MTMFPEIPAGNSVIPLGCREVASLNGEKILKSQVGALPVFFGQRILDNLDYQKLQEELYPFSIENLVIPETDDMQEADPKVLRPLAENLKEKLDTAAGPLVVFIITSAQSAEHIWLKQLPQKLREYRQQKYGRKDTVCYEIIWGGYFPNLGQNVPKEPYNSSEEKAHNLGSVYLDFDGDAPSAGTKRLVEFMNRLMGNDLKGDEFPNYSPEEIKKIAWHINRESFNMWFEKKGAIPKYPIGENGRPIFPF